MSSEVKVTPEEAARVVVSKGYRKVKFYRVSGLVIYRGIRIPYGEDSYKVIANYGDPKYLIKKFGFSEAPSTEWEESFRYELGEQVKDRKKAELKFDNALFYLGVRLRYLRKMETDLSIDELLAVADTVSNTLTNIESCSIAYQSKINPPSLRLIK
jgi:hypothetical protein